MASKLNFDKLKAAATATAKLVMAPETLDLVGQTYPAIWDTDKEALRNDLKGSILLLKNKKYAVVPTRSAITAAQSSSQAEPEVWLAVKLIARHVRIPCIPKG